MAEIKPKKQIVLTEQANDFIMSLPVGALTDMRKAISNLSMLGRLTVPDAKKIGDNLFEIRVKSDNLQCRAFYCYTIVGNVIYILSGFIKKTQKTPLQEIRKAMTIKRRLGL